jgi:hypothetical protein
MARSSDKSNTGSIASDAKLLLACLVSLDTLASGTSVKWVAYQAAQAILELCARPDGMVRTFYAFPSQNEKLEAMKALVSALGDGTNEALNPRVLDALDAIQEQVYGDMERYLTNCD